MIVLPERPLARRVAHGLFWLGLPVVVAALLFRPEESVVRVTDGPFAIELNPRSGYTPLSIALMVGHRSRLGWPVPPVVLAILVGAALPWVTVSELGRPR